MPGPNDIEAEIAAAKANGHDKAPLRIVRPTALQGLLIPERRWIVPEWMPHGYVTGLFGPGGTGKSLLAMQLMTAAAFGKPWLGVPVEPVRSIGVFCEDDADELHRRQAAINYQLYGCQFDELDAICWLPRLGEDNLLMTVSRTGRGESTPFYDELCAMAQDEKAGLIVLDTLADVFGGDQNSAGQVRQFVQFWLGRLARTVGGVLVCAHPSRAGQNNGSGESGSVQWDAAFRSRLYLADPKKEDDARIDLFARVLTRKKANYAARDEAIDLSWHDGVFRRDTDFDKDRPSAEIVFLELLDKMTAEDRPVSEASRASNYAPKMFEQQPAPVRRGYRKADFVRAMNALFTMKEIVQGEYGRAGDLRKKIVRSTQYRF
jgi:RecA-family ATPase